MKASRYHKAVLDNGIRVVTEEIPFVKSVSVGIWVEVGSRDEEESEAGLSHFLEHMLFKGTARRNAREIAQEIDSLGGDLNAFTSREATSYYTKVADEHLFRAAGLLADLFRNSVFRPIEIEREKKVVLEEIKMVEDDPEDLIHDLLTENIWPGNPISRSILGTPASVRSISRSKLTAYLRRKYRPERVVIAAAGRFNRSAFLRQVDRAFRTFGRNLNSPAPVDGRQTPIMGGRRVLIRKKRLEQAHLCLGLPGLPFTHRDRFGALALNALLGGGMSSRLFQEVREKRGLAYSIYSHLTGFKDAGLLTIYAASSPRGIRKVLNVTLEELERLKKKGFRREEFRRAVNQVKGMIMLSLESTNSRMSRLGRDEIYFGRFFSLEETLAEIGRIKPQQLERISRDLLDSKKMSLTLLGPVDMKASQALAYLS